MKKASVPSNAEDAGLRFYHAQTSWEDAPAYVPAKEGWLDADGAKLWYQDSGGSGPPIVFLHAATGSAGSWGYQQSHFHGKGYRVVVYSRRGHYRSRVTSPAAEVSDAADLLLLARQLDLPRFHLVGTAAGGFAAMDFALSYPERLRSLVIASSLCGIDEPEFAAVLERLLTPEFMALPAYLKELGPSYRALNPQGTARWIEMERQANQGVRAKPGTDNVVNWNALQGLRLPTMFLTGDADLYMPPALFTLLKPHVPHVRYAVIAGAGHSSPWEQPRAFNAALLSFIAQH